MSPLYCCIFKCAAKIIFYMLLTKNDYYFFTLFIDYPNIEGEG